MSTRFRLVDAVVEAAGLVASDFKYADEEGVTEVDRSWCPYNRRGLPGADPQGICSFGCREEPSCHTDGPWPLTALMLAIDALAAHDAAHTPQSECEKCGGEGVIAVMGSHPGDEDFEPCDCEHGR